MIVDNENRWCILTPPKTASTTLNSVFGEHPELGGEVKGGQHEMDPPPGVPRILVTVRDPWTRTVSLWRHACLDRYQGLCNEASMEPFPLREETRLYLAVAVEDYPFLSYLDDVDAERLDEFFSYSLCRWLEGVNEAEPIRFENLEADLRAVLPDVPWGEKMPYHNRNVLVTVNHPLIGTETKNYLAVPDPLEDPEARRRVLAWCGGDFTRFGYSTDYPGTEAASGSS